MKIFKNWSTFPLYLYLEYIQYHCTERADVGFKFILVSLIFFYSKEIYSYGCSINGDGTNARNIMTIMELLCVSG